ncbi:NAD(P)H-hydrate dehydratase [Catalinimonas niigatensis]|uniref:NAD(P)H-hydrate dehydratase n=1 Tax=Catalinimonas niigatensis TaxID=1397264 RepID=UPI002665BB49|nr:NAD(P)H-hydrate dehydratase [Catalinimonas niigatensis]WPP48205.1 NAD(P)H-hydrate dehydratase [Catalinimonas niigatensis]
MKILSAQQTRDADASTIQNEPIASIDLMERAARAFTRQFFEVLGSTVNPVYVFSGPGNNGGDGLAFARLLRQHPYKVNVFTVHATDKGSEDFRINRDRLEEYLTVRNIETVQDIPEIPEEAIIVDGLFGSGLSRRVEGIFAEVINNINNSGATVISIDIPSGLFADHPVDEERAPIVKADHTFTFQMPKLSFLLPKTAHFIGKWEVLDIGLNRAFIEKTKTDYYYTDQPLAKSLLKKRAIHTHKGDYGKTILVCGSYGKMGAAVLCARACLHTGVGLLTVHVPECGYQIMQIANPEAMTTVDPHQYIFTELAQKGGTDLDKYDTVGVGPGIGTAEETVEALKNLIKEAQARQIPMVLDADALNICGRHRELLDLLPDGSILTPHPKEFERLTEPAKNDFHRLHLLQEFTKSYKLFVVLKGAHTAVGTPDGEVFFNSTGNPGMASGGTGDALTGIITALVSQKYNAFDAALLGVYLHGLAGDLAAEHLSQEAMLASNLIDHLGVAFKTLA